MNNNLRSQLRKTRNDRDEILSHLNREFRGQNRKGERAERGKNQLYRLYSGFKKKKKNTENLSMYLQSVITLMLFRVPVKLPHIALQEDYQRQTLQQFFRWLEASYMQTLSQICATFMNGREMLTLKTFKL